MWFCAELTCTSRGRKQKQYEHEHEASRIWSGAGKIHRQVGTPPHAWIEKRETLLSDSKVLTLPDR
jgi:hypothetical protein